MSKKQEFSEEELKIAEFWKQVSIWQSEHDDKQLED